MAQWGEQLEFLEEIEETTGQRPPALLDRPTLEEPLSAFYRAYLTLSRDRTYDMGSPAPISNRNILDFFTLHDVEKRYWDNYTDYFFRIDRIWMEVKQAQMERESKTTSKG